MHQHCAPTLALWYAHTHAVQHFYTTPRLIDRVGADQLVRRSGLDLDAGTLDIDETLISVAGRAEESDGKTAAGVRSVALDAFTIEALRGHLAMLDEERRAFGEAYHGSGWLYVWPDGRRPHPDSVTDRFNRLVDRAGVRRIRLHDVRHTYATLALNSGVEPKIVSDRVGHSNPGITFQITLTGRPDSTDRPQTSPEA